MNLIIAIASKEFHQAFRNYWFISITLIFALLSFGLTYFGSAVSGTTEAAPVTTIITSLASLSAFIIPLIALLLSYDSFVGEQENGTLLLLFTYPISKQQLLLGKFIGHGSIIILATLIGFGLPAMMLFFQYGALYILVSFGTFIISASLLGLSFTAIALLISLSVNEKAKAAGIALIIWFLFALVFDLALLALLVGTEYSFKQITLSHIMLLNPADIFRLVNLPELMNHSISSSLASALNNRLSPVPLFAALIAWIAIPLSITLTLLKRKNL